MAKRCGPIRRFFGMCGRKKGGSMGGRLRPTKAEVLRRFREEVLPYIRQRYEQDGRVDTVARREAWNDYTDMLAKNREITTKQYEDWDNPF